MSEPDTRLAGDPIIQFRSWFQDAERHPELQLPDALCLSTINKQGRPSARMVLLKDFNINGFSFFTNVESPKAKELRARPYAAMTFHWAPLRRQVRIEGKVSRLPKKASDVYFTGRPRLSQISSWASKQSEPLASRELLEQRVVELEAKFKGKDIPAPKYWQGFLLRPDRIEFWQERPNRLHDRWLYTRRGTRWSQVRLYP